MPTEAERPAPTPSPEDKAKVEAFVADCIEAMERGEHDPASRICGERPDLLTRVQRRLVQLAKHGLIPGTEPAPPTAIGPYRIVRELGSGGMGSVYLAEQSTPVRRQVALKVVKLGMDTREVVARFQAERQALALMNHPHIAQVFDAGITAEGRPFFAMEYVAGEPLTALADKRALSTESRVRLLQTICRAVQHAHDRGFIHRDLKPSNVLVAEHGGELVPKVIDFGIAKATTAAAANSGIDGMATRADQVLGTPEYMSPEQACSGGLDVDTRTDVYSLGVVLYELLCGELPFDSRRLRRASRHEMEQILLDELPTLPSKRLSVIGDAALAARGGDRSSLQRRIAGELDWITLKALHKQRDQRYPSALAFAEDLERWLRHEPVLAAPPGHTYRLRKFVQRHRVAVLAGVLVMLSLVLGLGTSLAALADARRAQQQEAKALADVRAFYDLARDAVGNLVDVADEGLVEVPQAEAVRRQMLASAMHFYAELQSRNPEEPELRVDLVAANHRIGILQRRLGLVPAAIATLQQCEQDLGALPAAVAGTPRTARLSVEVPQALALALAANGRSDEARSSLGRALAALAVARRSHEDAFSDADNLEARLLTTLAAETPDVAATLDLFARAMAAHGRAHDEPRQRRDRARCALLYAEALTRQNRIDEAAGLLADAASQLGSDGPESASDRELEAGVQMPLARVLRRLGRPAEARTATQRAVELRSQLATEHPDVPVHGEQEAEALQFLSQLATDEARPADALPPIDRAIAVRERLAARQPENLHTHVALARAMLVKGEALLYLWQHHGAAIEPVLAAGERAIAVLEPVRQSHRDNASVVLTSAAAHATLAAAHEARGDTDAAHDEHLTILEMLEQLLPRHRDDPAVHSQLAHVCSQLLFSHLRSREWDAALAMGTRGLEHVHTGLQLDARHAPTHAIVPQLVARLAAVHQGRNDPASELATLLQLVESPLFDTDARECGALLLGQMALEGRTDGGQDAALERAAKELRQAIDRRGPLPAAAARPGERAGASHTASRQRDFDLRVLLADIHARLDDPDAQSAVIGEALQLAKSMQHLSADRRRNLFGQAAELALQRDDPLAAEAHLEELLRQVGPDGRANAMVAALLCKCLTATTDEANRERFAARAVVCLAAGIEKGELSRAQAASGTFAPLRGRADYEAMMAR